jgi:hypothetical protein
MKVRPLRATVFKNFRALRREQLLDLLPGQRSKEILEIFL